MTFPRRIFLPPQLFGWALLEEASPQTGGKKRGPIFTDKYFPGVVTTPKGV